MDRWSNQQAHWSKSVFDANPCAYANQEQHGNTGENGDLAHVNSPF
jgi:hypothetical protein